MMWLMIKVIIFEQEKRNGDTLECRVLVAGGNLYSTTPISDMVVVSVASGTFNKMDLFSKKNISSHVTR